MGEDDFGFGGQQTIVAPDEKQDDIKTGESKEEEKTDLGNGEKEKADLGKETQQGEQEKEEEKETNDLISQIKPGVELEISGKMLMKKFAHLEGFASKITSF